MQFVVQAASKPLLHTWKVSEGCYHLQATSVYTSQGSFAPHGEVSADMSQCHLLTSCLHP